MVCTPLQCIANSFITNLLHMLGNPRASMNGDVIGSHAYQLVVSVSELGPPGHVCTDDLRSRLARGVECG